jgi:hypothetical protein
VPDGSAAADAIDRVEFTHQEIACLAETLQRAGDD